MRTGSKFLALVAVTFAIAVVYRICPEAALIEAVALIIFLGLAACRIQRP